jgi:cellulose synthase/poly-beta-1,6-N-acetylglucosamine synthase-like glycosyltransferase
MVLFLIITASVLTVYYIFLVLYFERGLDRLGGAGNSELPFVSLIVAARNEQGNLPALLERLERQTYPADRLEILLVDDRSTDRTPVLMERFASGRSGVKVVRIQEGEPHPSPKKRAISRAVEIAAGEIILTTDADCLPGPDWAREMARRFDPETGVVLGYAPYRTDGPYGSFFHRLLGLEYFAMGAVAAATAGMGRPSTCNGANFSFRKKAFEEVGGYGSAGKWLSGDDDLLLQRIRSKTQWKIRFAASPEAAIPNNPPGNFREFARQRIRFSSKHLAYPAGMVAVLSGVYLFYLCLLVLTISAFFIFILIPLCAYIWLVKIAVEIRFLAKAQKLLENRPLLKYYSILAPLHLVYVVLFPILGQTIRPKWK